MTTVRERALWILAGISWALGSVVPAFADDTELFVGTARPEFSGQPNILFIIDTSGSMLAEVEALEAYDPDTTYPGACVPTRIYWSDDADPPPECSQNRWFEIAALKCNAAIQAFARGAGFFRDRMGQFDDVNDRRWEDIEGSQKNQFVECQDDSGIHGDGSNGANVYARNGNASTPWTSNINNEIAWDQGPVDNYSLFSANYVNWYHGPTGVVTRIEVVKQVATDTINGIDGVNVGLMRLNETEGGPVIQALEDVAASRLSILAAIDSLEADGRTPLAETLYEAALYYRGGAVDYGNRQGPPNSVDAARTAPGSAQYRSPVEFACQKNFIVLLTDGAPTEDLGATPKVPILPGFSAEIASACDGSGDGACLDDIADYLNTVDISSSLPDPQNVVTYTIGFTVDLPLLQSTAARGGGEYFTADDTASLTAALTDIVNRILEEQTTFSTPTVAVNSFNRTQNLNDLFVAVFQPSKNFHWPGNLKKYRLNSASGAIVDANGATAIDSNTGYFASTAQSFWSADVDGASVPAGGAAAQLPDPDVRRLFTYLSGSDLTSPNNQVDSSNSLLDDSLLGIGGLGDPTAEQVIAFARGADVEGAAGNVADAEPRFAMGDPLHAQPIPVIYGGTPSNPNIDDALVFFATNDGYLHAIDPTDGREAWAFIPPEFLEDLIRLYENEPVANRHYGIDGSPTVQLLERNNDGIIDSNAGEKAYLFFGMRRGGTTYYGLDITDKNSPRLLWRLDASDLAGLGQSWSKPVPTRVLVGNGSGQNDDRLVLIMAGGYDATQDDPIGGTDVTGNAIYIVDSETGSLLWHTRPSGADLDLPQMQYSIPADVKVIDFDSDRLADRMYAADMGGQVWRFDIANGQQSNNLVAGGVIAQLGAAPDDPPTAEDSRRFYYSPDVAFVDAGDASFLHIGIGSGHRAHPNSVDTHDRFYSLRDYSPFTARTQAQYDSAALSAITDEDLVDITDDIDAVVGPGSAGWRFDLRSDGAWQGEKVLAEARTFADQIFFTTFTPDTGTEFLGCEPRLGTNRLYIMDILSGRPVTNLDDEVDSDELTLDDRYMTIEGTISSEVVFLFPPPEDADCVGEQCTPPPVACVDLFCFGLDFENNPIRTYWSQESNY